MVQCDKEKLVSPILDLYGVAYGKHMQRDGSDKLSSYELIKQATLPTTIEFKQLTKSGKLVTQKRKLFGTLVADMEKHVRDHGLSTGFKDITEAATVPKTRRTSKENVYKTGQVLPSDTELK